MRIKLLLNSYWWEIQYHHVMCFFGIHPGGFIYNLSEEMVPWCFWCSKQVGKPIKINSQAEFDEYEGGFNRTFRKKR